ALDALEGEEYRRVKTRRTFRFELSDQRYFAKLHYGVGWMEILKNLIQFKLPVTGARNERDALQLLEQRGVPVPTVVGFSSSGSNPATRQSSIVTKSLLNTLSLEDCCRQKLVSVPRKYNLIPKVAQLTRRMHEAGVNHRDCYICHFHLQLEEKDLKAPTLYVIDLHRAQIRKHTPMRWRVKDVGSLLFSAAEENALEVTDLFRFMRAYSNKPLRQTLSEDHVFWSKVLVRAQKLYLKNHSQLSPLLM
ncbi:MAG: lipopolysaccharide core heptose(I) kinase RfaP, partial [Gammaproteobacteria bacterium]|nr:lipopolysaccharide core heptose(I) kinase RfaP [Gammaproteobacteria bacterium]